MYVLVKAIGVRKTQGSRWSEITIDQVPVFSLFDIYRKAFITLSNNFLANPVTIELDSLREKFIDFTGTFNEMLMVVANNVLSPTVVPPVLNPRYAVYSDAFRAGYKMEPLNVLTSFDAPQPPSSKTSLRIIRTNPVTDMERFHKSCLVSINGFFHRTDYDGTYAYVVDGNSSKIKSQQNQMGFLSFNNLGSIECVPIDKNMIYKQSAESTFSNRTYIKLNKDITNKSVFMVLGGYLVFLDGKTLKLSGEDVFTLDIGSIPFVERFFEAMPYLDYDKLGLPASQNNPSALDLRELLSDEVMTKYLTMPQTFFCIIDTPEIFMNRISVKSTNLPGMFIGYKEPKYPLIVSNGRVAEYWKTFEDGQWAMNVYDSYLHNKVFSTIPESSRQVIGDADEPSLRVRNSTGYLLEIGKDF